MTDRCKCGRFIKEGDMHCRRCGETDLVMWPVIEALLEGGELERIKEGKLSERDLQRLYSEQIRWTNGAVFEEFLERVFDAVDGEYNPSERERSWI